MLSIATTTTDSSSPAETRFVQAEATGPDHQRWSIAPKTASPRHSVGTFVQTASSLASDACRIWGRSSHSKECRSCAAPFPHTGDRHIAHPDRPNEGRPCARARQPGRLQILRQHPSGHLLYLAANLLAPAAAMTMLAVSRCWTRTIDHLLALCGRVIDRTIRPKRCHHTRQRRQQSLGDRHHGTQPDQPGRPSLQGAARLRGLRRLPFGRR